jgi:hypothetical protein
MMPLTTASLRPRPKTALIILNPRDIPYCMDALRALRVPKLWLSYMYEPQAALEANKQISLTGFDRYVMISDDCEPTQDALDRVLAVHGTGRYDVVTGYSNFDKHLPFVNLCTDMLPPPPPSITSYGRFMLQREADVYDAPFPTTFTGLSFTCMSRALWEQFPIHCTEAGGQMDYQLSWELQTMGIQIAVAPHAFVLHHKDRFGVYPDASPEKQLLVGVREPAVTWTDLDLAEVA